MEKFRQSFLAVGALAWLIFSGAVQAQQTSSKLPAQGGVDTCNISLHAEVQPRAMVALTLTGSCLPNETIVLHHSGLMFSLKTDSKGIAKVIVPALVKKAIFIAIYENGDGALTMIDVPDMVRYQRIVLQWQGAKGVQLHAYKDGAGYGSEGHLWSQTEVFDPNNEDEGREFLTLLGNDKLSDGFHAEIASFPVQNLGNVKAFSLSVEMEITVENCGRTIAGELLMPLADTKSDIQMSRNSNSRGLTLYVPECDMVGDFIVMKNVIENLNLSSTQ
ncbi:MAG: hypothetical protein P8M25_19545 [Paracoccaceae bacterium]|nr:hypothetical protein [Paracoccaceae bacterium]